MVSEKLLILISKLDKRTLEGKISWEPTTNSYEFQASFANQSIIVGETGDDYYVQLRDKDGQTLDTFHSSEYVDPDLIIKVFAYDENPHSGKVVRYVRDLYENARRVALNVNDAVDDILSQLDS